MRFQHLKRWQLTAQEAMIAGAPRASFLTHQWDVSGNCESPVHREYYGAEPLGLSPDGTRLKGRGPQMTIEFQARCRGCLNCLKARAAHWRYKCLAEFSSAPRTWFGTLTFRPEEVYRAKCAANLRLIGTSTQWDELEEAEAFRFMAHEMGKEVTRYLKRLRKRGANLRYCLVAEAHKSGVPHFHMLVHEGSDLTPVRHKTLVDCWTAGFCVWKLADDRSPYYVTKYLTKSMRARIRASLDYGTAIQPTSLDTAEGVRGVKKPQC